MKNYVILDRNAGLLQYTCTAASPEKALQKFDADIGIDPHNAGLNVEEWDIREVTPEKREEWEEWGENGCPADAIPSA